MLLGKVQGAGGSGASSLLTLVPTTGSTIEWDGNSPLTLSTATEYTVTANKSANVSVKMWGAGGACGYAYNQGISSTSNQGVGGGGGYTTGTIAFVAGQQYIFRVGQGGARSNTGNGIGATYLAGGLPSATTATYGGTQAGGYSGIFTTTTVSQANALLIAGGGGGGAATNGSTSGAGGDGAQGMVS